MAPQLSFYTFCEANSKSSQIQKVIESQNPICFCTDFFKNFYCHWFCSMILINIRILKGCIKLWRICSFRKENAICFILLWVIINKLLSTKHSQSVRNFSLRTSSILWITLSEKTRIISIKIRNTLWQRLRKVKNM